MSTAQKGVLVSGALITFCLGIIYVWSIFQKPVMDTYGWSVSDAAFTFNIMLVTFVMGNLFGGRLQDKIGPRPVVLAGGLLFTGGIFFTSMIPVALPWLIYVLYGGLAGLGVGMGFGSIIACVQKWLPQRRGLATGIIVCAFGASAVVLGPLANSLVGAFGLASTFRIFAVIFFAIIMVFVWFIKNPPRLSGKTEDPAKYAGIKQYAPKDVLRIRYFYFILLCMMFIEPAYFILSPLIKMFASSVGLADSMAVFAVMMSGVASAAGGFIFPVLSDHKGRKFAIYIMLALTLAASILMLFVQGAYYVFLVAIIAFCYGGPGGVFPALIADYYGEKNMGANYGIILLGFAAAALLSPLLASIFQAGDPQTTLVFIVPIVTCIAGIFLLRAIRPPVRDKE